MNSDFVKHLILLFVLMLAHEGLSQNSTNFTFEIPIADLRASLPEDKAVTLKTWTVDKWKKNKGAFFRNETLEVALGYKIRAQEKDRKHEGKLGPGFVVANGAIVAQGGWRVHKDVPMHSDFFDGTFKFRLKIVQNRKGLLEPQVYDTNLHWNKSVAGKIVNLAGFGIIDNVVDEIAKKLQGQINTTIATELRKFQAKYPQLSQSRSAMQIQILPAVVRITVPYSLMQLKNP